ncbi:GNAT family N-acetyltransferase [Aliikangiella coralliicola]|uniref:GNAT family N-acetyltransferase n=1 Tax=Aliikangiella coralliicola TaxID=2592383 RepID=A0A545U7U9_9GAMM|nr:GNAT family N-acetyltransferase [Aliikangiella coralliicola]TQV85541.1 GNAT family N-acetyltransferase [Aliikangiella coralliicola]
MSDIIIRKATQTDLPTLLSFEQGIIEYERPFDPTLKREKISYYDIEKMIDDNQVEVLVAEYQNELIGSGYAKIVQSKPYLTHSQHCYLGFMYVSPNHRGRGVNQLIVNGLKEWALSRGINEIRLEVYGENAGAIKAYEKAGFKRNLVEMRISLDN